MLFEKLDGTKMTSLHSPNEANMKRAVFFNGDVSNKETAKVWVISTIL